MRFSTQRWQEGRRVVVTERPEVGPVEQLDVGVKFTCVPDGVLVENSPSWVFEDATVEALAAYGVTDPTPADLGFLEGFPVNLLAATAHFEAEYAGIDSALIRRESNGQRRHPGRYCIALTQPGTEAMPSFSAQPLSWRYASSVSNSKPKRSSSAGMSAL